MCQCCRYVIGTRDLPPTAAHPSHPLVLVPLGTGWSVPGSVVVAQRPHAPVPGSVADHLPCCSPTWGISGKIEEDALWPQCPGPTHPHLHLLTGPHLKFSSWSCSSCDCRSSSFLAVRPGALSTSDRPTLSRRAAFSCARFCFSSERSKSCGQGR